jgi:hypothetical protein
MLLSTQVAGSYLEVPVYNPVLVEVGQAVQQLPH